MANLDIDTVYGYGVRDIEAFAVNPRLLRDNKAAFNGRKSVTVAAYGIIR